jgi:predicted DNA-binding ribbon-helix-helix protein
VSKPGRKPRERLKITVSEKAYALLVEKARNRRMTVEALIGELLDLEMGTN